MYSLSYIYGSLETLFQKNSEYNNSFIKGYKKSKLLTLSIPEVSALLKS